MIRKGDILKIRPEWSHPGDERFTWVALEDEGKGRVWIELQCSGFIRPNQIVQVSMVERVEGRPGLAPD